jgi:hypothetical protein
MQRHLALLSLAAAALLAGCVQPPQSAAMANAPAGPCDAQAARFAVGYTSTDALADEVRRRSGAETVRVLRPGDVTTMEFNPERVNVVVGEDSRVSAVRCG